MSTRIFTQEQIKDLLNNKNVESCSDKSITFTTVFKKCAIKLYEQGLTSREIFQQAEFNLDVIGKNHPKECLKRWRRIVKRKGIEGLNEARGSAGKGCRPKTKGLSDADRIERLEIQVEYLKVENAFLAKLRAKRME